MDKIWPIPKTIILPFSIKISTYVEMCSLGIIRAKSFKLRMDKIWPISKTITLPFSIKISTYVEMCILDIIYAKTIKITNGSNLANIKDYNLAIFYKN